MTENQAIFDRPVMGAICVTIIVVPLAFFTGAFNVFGVIKYALLLTMSAVAALAWLWSGWRRGSISLPSGTPGLFLALFVFWLALTTATSSVPALSLFGLRNHYLGLATYLAVVVLMLAAAGISWDEKKIRSFYYALCLAGSVASLIGIAQFFGASYPFDLKHLFAGLSYSTFGNPVSFGMFLALSIPIAAHLALDGRESQVRIVGWSCSGLFSFGLWTSGSSGAIVAALGAVSAYLFLRLLWSGKQSTRTTVQVVLALLIAVLVFGGFFAVTQEHLALGQRGWIWAAGFEVAANSPIFGTGLENLQEGLRALGKRPGGHLPGGAYLHTHNLWLHLATTCGWPALLLFIAFLLTGGRSAVQTRARIECGAGRELPPLFGAVFGYILAAQFNPEDLAPMAVFWVIIGIILSFSSSMRKYRFPNHVPLMAGAWATIAVIAGLAVFSLSIFRAEINLLQGNNAADFRTGSNAFRAIQASQPWQTQYYSMYVYRFIPEVDSLNGPIGSELIAVAKRGLSANPMDPENKLALGQLYRALAENEGDPDLHRQARSMFEQVIAMDQYNPEAMKLLALTYFDLGDRKASLWWIKEYVDVFDEDQDLLDLKERIRGESGRTE